MQVRDLVDLVACELNAEHLALFDDDAMNESKKMFTQRIRRSIGLAIHRGWAKLLLESNSERQHRRAQKDVFRGSNLGPQYLYTGLAYAPTEAGFVHGAPPHMWYSWSQVQKTIFPRFYILAF